MAIDTALKRASAINVGSPWRGILPFPDGVIGAVDRPVVSFLYSLAAAAITTVYTRLFIDVTTGRLFWAPQGTGAGLPTRIIPL